MCKQFVQGLIALTCIAILWACQTTYTTSSHKYSEAGDSRGSTTPSERQYVNAASRANYRTIEDTEMEEFNSIVEMNQEFFATSRFVLPDNGNVVGEVKVVRSRYEDTLYDIARLYDLGIEELVDANPDVDRWVPGRGTSIVLPTRFILPNAPRTGIVLNIASKRLFYYPDKRVAGEPVVITHPVGVGRVGWSTPTGTTKVVRKDKDPSWRVPQSVLKEHRENGDPLPNVVPPGPENPLGRHVLRLGMPGYLIHGTNKPDGVGMRVSHGCVRLYPEDIEFLYENVPIGAKVTIVNQPYLVGWLGDEIYIEAHTPLEDDARDLRAVIENELHEASRSRQIPVHTIDWEKVAKVTQEARGLPVLVTKESLEIEMLAVNATP